MQSFIYLSIAFCLYTALHISRNMLSNFLVIPPEVWKTIGPTTWLFILFSTASCFLSVNCPCLMSTLFVIIFSLCLSVISGWFSSRSWNVSFTSRVFLLAWQLLLFLLPLTSFTACHDNCDCLSSGKFLI